jgi:membrane-bound lytic murein transglycosylase F
MHKTKDNPSRLSSYACGLWLLLALLITDVSADADAPVYAYEYKEQSVAGGEDPTADSEDTLRVLYHRRFLNPLGISEAEQRLVEGYAAEAGLQPVWIEVDEPWQLLNHLLEGNGDLIVSQSQGLTGGIDGKVQLLEPWATTVQQVVSRQDSARINSIEDLAYRQVALKRSSPVWEQISAMLESNPGMDIITIPESMTEEEILQRVKTGGYDLTVMSSLYLKTWLPDHPELAAVFDITDRKQMAWAVKKEAAGLYQSLNTYLKKYLLAMNLSDIARDDLPALQEKRSIRLITYQSPTNLFYKNGKVVGFEYMLLNRFAKQNDMRVDLVLASSHEEMKSLLIEGKGDVIAASLPRQSMKSKELAYTEPYMYAAPVVVGRASGEPIVDIQDLDGRRIYLPVESPYRAHLETLRQWHGIDFQILGAEPNMNTEATLFMVSQGMYDLTVLPSHQIVSEFKRQIGLRAEFALGEPESNVWVVRSGDTRLLANLNNFIRNIYKKDYYNTLYTKYIRSPRPQNGNSRLLAKFDQLSPWDREIQEAAEKYDFDWRLIAAQMYQESGFNPSALSPVGAEGLMQIMPATAEELGVIDANDPGQSINAGVAYLGQLRDSFKEELLLEDRIWFSLAAYNAGPGRLNQVRKYTQELGLDPNRWFNNVETAMLKLSRPVERDGEQVVFCRCGQTVVYVREIKTLYQNYINLTEIAQFAGVTTPRPVADGI